MEVLPLPGGPSSTTTFTTEPTLERSLSSMRAVSRATTCRHRLLRVTAKGGDVEDGDPTSSGGDEAERTQRGDRAHHRVARSRDQAGELLLGELDLDLHSRRVGLGMVVGELEEEAGEPVGGVERRRIDA